MYSGRRRDRSIQGMSLCSYPVYQGLTPAYCHRLEAVALLFLGFISPADYSNIFKFLIKASFFANEAFTVAHRMLSSQYGLCFGRAMYQIW